MPTISARTEAVVRRFLPEVREVEVDADLRPSCKFDPKGPRFGLDDLQRELSAAALVEPGGSGAATHVGAAAAALATAISAAGKPAQA